MSQLHAPDIDQAIAEFKAAVGDLFSTPERREIGDKPTLPPAHNEPSSLKYSGPEAA